MLLQVGRSATPQAIKDRGSPAQKARAPSAVTEGSFDALGLDVVLGFQVLRAPGTASAELPRLGTAGAPFLPPCVHGLAPQLIILSAALRHSLLHTQPSCMSLCTPLQHNAVVPDRMLADLGGEGFDVGLDETSGDLVELGTQPASAFENMAR